MLRRLLCCALALGTGACDGNTDPDGPATLRITTSTSGEDIDPEGYSFSLDGNPHTRIGVNATITLSGLAAGEHVLSVEGLAANCALAGGNSQVLTLAGGDTTEAILLIACQAVPRSHPAGTVASVATLSGAPYGVAVSEAGVVYAALIGTSSLIRGDLGTMSFGPVVEVGETPPHVAFTPDGSVVFATLQTGRGLAAVSAATNTLITTVPLASDGFNLLVGPTGDRVYVTTADGTLYVVETSGYTVVTTLNVGPAANGLAFSPDGSVLYVSSRDAGTVVAIDPVSNTVTRTYDLGGAPQRLAVAPDGSELYVANELHGLDVVNVASGGVTSVDFGTAGYGLGLTPDGAELYVLLPDAGEVRVVARATRAPLHTIPIGGRPRNVAFSRDGRTALVTNEEAVVFIR